MVCNSDLKSLGMRKVNCASFFTALGPGQSLPHLSLLDNDLLNMGCNALQCTATEKGAKCALNNPGATEIAKLRVSTGESWNAG
jgi:hypothetical protein